MQSVWEKRRLRSSKEEVITVEKKEENSYEKLLTNYKLIKDKLEDIEKAEEKERKGKKKANAVKSEQQNKKIDHWTIELGKI